MFRHLKLTLTFGLILWVAAAAIPTKNSRGVGQALEHFRHDSQVFAASLVVLDKKLQIIDSLRPESVSDAKMALKESRLAYKKIEYLLDYFFFTSSLIYNRAPKNEVEEPFLEYQQPAGLQYIETMLFDEAPWRFRAEYEEQMRLLNLAAPDLNALLYQFESTDKKFLESVRLSVVKIISLGITGFDAPALKSGIAESAVALETAAQVLAPFLSQYPHARFTRHLDAAIRYLHANPDFDTFDRMRFLTDFALPLQTEIGRWLRVNNLVFNRDGMLNAAADHLFSPNALHQPAFKTADNTRAMIQLGERLFSDKRLSATTQKSCASCHIPGAYFADGIPKSIGIEPHIIVARNAPSLFYAGYQHKQFWDGRAATLEEQVSMVVRDSLEMGGNPRTIMQALHADRQMNRAFRKAFPGVKKEGVREQDIYKALAAYIRTLEPFNSPFDQYIAGNRKALTDDQVAGFNIFMGKAQCGTCHFAPLFNGLIPPNYVRTEFEVIGTTQTDELEKPEKDTDRGRAMVMPIQFYEQAFKTPTVRNVAKTAPYMHNGAFSTLEKVIDFYDKGGAVGLGLELESQSLPATALNLSEIEKKRLIAFLEALTDSVP